MESVLNLNVSLVDSEIKPFWNEKSSLLSKDLWLPGKEVEDNFTSATEHWNTTFSPKDAVKQFLVDFPVEKYVPVEKDGKENDKELVILARKIRIYPENEELYIQALHTFRRMYNLVIEAFEVNNRFPNFTLSKELVEKVQAEDPEVFNYNLCNWAYRKAEQTVRAIIKKRKNKLFCKPSFMSWKYSSRYFVYTCVAKSGIMPEMLGGVKFAEKLPLAAGDGAVVVLYEHGKWYACCQKRIRAEHKSTEPKRIVALDPGVRTFQTSYSDSQVVKFGMGFAEQKLLKLALTKDKLLSERQLLVNLARKLPKNEEGFRTQPQWMKDQFRSLEKKLNKLFHRRRDLITDLHNRVAFYLVKNYDVILLPTFETSNMVSKSGRNLRRKTVRSMLNLCHYKFKQKLLWMGKKYGKIVFIVNEAYTSKTLPDGTIKKNLGGAKKVKVGNTEVDRDMNGARNILIRYLTLHGKPRIWEWVPCTLIGQLM